METLPRVFVTRQLPGDSLERLTGVARVELWSGSGSPSPQALAAGAREAEGLLCLLTDRVDEVLIRGCPRLRVISSCAVGVDHIDLEAATRRRIPVGHTPGVLTETTADLAFALLLAAARRVAEGDRFVRAGGWVPERRWEPDMLLGRDVHGAVLGILGLGEIGKAVANRARGFGMRVLAWSRTPRDHPGVEQVALEQLLSLADFVTVHLPLTPETRLLLDAGALRSMKRGAVLVNTARGGIVDELALAESLRSGHLGAAALDVFEQEPLAPDSPLLGLEQLVVTPHIGSASVATRQRMATLSVENLLVGLRGERLPHCANPRVYDAPGEIPDSD